MLKIIINSWKLRDLAKSDPASYEFLRSVDSEIPIIEKAGEGYHEFSGYVNDLSQFPQSIIDICQLQAIKPMNVMVNGSVSGKGIKDALQANQVHLPGHELLQIRQVKVKEDCCTDDLNEELQDGWRMVAVCVKPGQRRPDYVLGRYFKD